MEAFANNLAVRSMNQEDGHSAMRWGTTIFDIFIRSPVRLTRSYDRLKSKKVASELG